MNTNALPKPHGVCSYDGLTHSFMMSREVIRAVKSCLYKLD